ncbi:MAG: helix-turn-helix domain-containing protein [Caulobacteraceae bacterium]
MSLFSPSIDEQGGREPRRDDLAALRPAKLTLADDCHVGEAMARARVSLDLSVDDIAQATHVRASHLAALEASDLDALPARPFAIGYIKAYARALGLDQEAVVARFKRESPGEETTLRAPLGDQFRRGRRWGKLALAVLGVILAMTVWNLLVRIRSAPPRTPASTAVVAIRPRSSPGPLVLGPPLPAPPEATTPPPYETPGLAAATAETGPDAAALATARIAAEAEAATPADPIPAGSPFTPRARVYGAPKGGSGVILMATRPMSLVVRGGGAVYFARQLATGEAWRAPDIAGLTADADVPDAVEVYVAGKAVGTLSQSQTTLASLAASISSAP